jgi:hypothetical protein
VRATEGGQEIHDLKDHVLVLGSPLDLERSAQALQFGQQSLMPFAVCYTLPDERGQALKWFFGSQRLLMLIHAPLHHFTIGALGYLAFSGSLVGKA